MKIIAIRRLQTPGAEARFDVEISEHLRLFGLSLRRNAGGQMRTVAPHSCGRHVASFHPVLAQQITEAAVAALGAAAHDRV